MLLNLQEQATIKLPGLSTYKNNQPSLVGEPINIVLWTLALRSAVTAASAAAHDSYDDELEREELDELLDLDPV